MSVVRVRFDISVCWVCLVSAVRVCLSLRLSLCLSVRLSLGLSVRLSVGVRRVRDFEYLYVSVSLIAITVISVITVIIGRNIIIIRTWYMIVIPHISNTIIPIISEIRER